MRRAVILFDNDCGFCRWSLSKLLAWDRHGRLRPIALQSEQADDLLIGMDRERKMASWHLVAPTAEATQAARPSLSSQDCCPPARRSPPSRARSLERRIGLTGGCPGTANAWAVSSVSRRARSTRPSRTGSPRLRCAASRCEADAHGRSQGGGCSRGGSAVRGPRIRPDRRRGDHGLAVVPTHVVSSREIGATPPSAVWGRWRL